MANIRDIKNRIESVRSTRQITKAMKMVAASKLRKAQENIVKARPYADSINEMLQTLKLKNRETEHPLLAEGHPEGKRALVVVTADRGLSGAFNFTINRATADYLEQHPKTDVICLGRKGAEFIKKHHGTPIKSFVGLFNEMDFSISKDVASYLLELFLNEGYVSIDVIYNEFKSAIQQDVRAKQLLPIIPVKSEHISTLEFIYEPDAETIIEELGTKYINVEIWRIMLESSASEQGARMTAMDSATDNAEELIGTLTLHYNRARQAAITTEIIEISSGADAINN
ncbi:MAG: ATP synthase F1 subunit gamma [Candidatus Cloacimonetes bacterium]|nr:ATP synthase F1 subunit gamma [Candidatus Cloacimonadota bacterium]